VPVVVAAVAAPAASASVDTSSVLLALGPLNGQFTRTVTAIVSLRDENPGGLEVEIEVYHPAVSWVSWGRSTTQQSGETGIATFFVNAINPYRTYRAWVTYKGAPLYSNEVPNDYGEMNG